MMILKFHLRWESLSSRSMFRQLQMKYFMSEICFKTIQDQGSEERYREDKIGLELLIVKAIT